jgi:probable rRNA maturation factor
MQRATRKVTVEQAGDIGCLPKAMVQQAIATVLDGEGVGAAEFSVTFLSGQRMRALNRRSFGYDRATDVIAFGLPHPGLLVGDIYICPSVARRTARELRLSDGEELLRLLVHGVLHVLGLDHPASDGRYESAMWRTQEDYVSRISRAAP